MLEAWEDPGDWVRLINAAAELSANGKPGVESAKARSERLAVSGITSGEPEVAAAGAAESSTGPIEDATAMDNSGSGPSEGVPPAPAK